MHGHAGDKLCRAAFSSHDADPAAALEDVEEAAAASGDARDDEVEVLMPAGAPVAPALLEARCWKALKTWPHKAKIVRLWCSLRFHRFCA